MSSLIPSGHDTTAPADRSLVIQVSTAVVREGFSRDDNVRSRFRQESPGTQNVARLEHEIPVRKREVMLQDHEPARKLPGPPMFAIPDCHWMKSRVLVLPLSALVITALVVWRYQREPDIAASDSEGAARQLAPRFELYDQQSKLVKFERYLGRTELLVVFFDDDLPLTENQILMRLREQSEAIEESGLQIVAISQATPHAVREAEKQLGAEFPFPVLTDIDLRTPIPAPVHRQWGLVGEHTSDPRPGGFHVDRRGMVAHTGPFPRPLEDVDAFLDARVGRWNGRD